MTESDDPRPEDPRPDDARADSDPAEEPPERPLEDARRAMEADPDDEALRRAFLARLTETELFLLMQDDGSGEDVAAGDTAQLSPAIFAVAEGRVVLAFDSESALAGFVGAAAPYAAMPGRALAQWLAGEEVGLGVNLTDSGEGTLLPPEALDWLAEVLGAAPAPQAVAGMRPEMLGPPPLLDAALLPALERALARAGALARRAVLASARYPQGESRLLIAFLDPEPGAEAALSRAVQEALISARLAAYPPDGHVGQDGLRTGAGTAKAPGGGTSDGGVDVAFPEAASPAAERLCAVGLLIELPDPRPTGAAQAAPPGSDPARPPRLR